MWASHRKAFWAAIFLLRPCSDLGSIGLRILPLSVSSWAHFHYSDIFAVCQFHIPTRSILSLSLFTLLFPLSLYFSCPLTSSCPNFWTFTHQANFDLSGKRTKPLKRKYNFLFPEAHNRQNKRLVLSGTQENKILKNQQRAFCSLLRHFLCGYYSWETVTVTKEKSQCRNAHWPVVDVP